MYEQAGRLSKASAKYQFFVSCSQGALWDLRREEHAKGGW